VVARRERLRRDRWFVGLAFTREVVRYALRTLPMLVGSTLLLIGLCAAVGEELRGLIHADPLTAYLATSPAVSIRFRSSRSAAAPTFRSCSRYRRCEFFWSSSPDRPSPASSHARPCTHDASRSRARARAAGSTAGSRQRSVEFDRRRPHVWRRTNDRCAPAPAAVHARNGDCESSRREDGWNSRDPARVSPAYTEDSVWRNRAEFIRGRAAIAAFLTRKWTRELDYRLIKELWAFDGNRIAVRFAYESHDDSGNWFRSYGNENWNSTSAV